MSSRKADLIAEDLLARIVSGKLSVGSTLPREPELATAYGANRSVIREAIKKLEVHRLVRPVRRRGTLVLDPFSSLSPEVIRAMLRTPDGRLSPTFLRCLLEVRAHLDGQMVALAARRRTEEDMERLREAWELLASAAGSAQAYARGVDSMSLAIATATGNPIFPMLVHWQRHITADLDDLFLLVRLPTEGHLEGYRQLVEAIEHGDEDLARGLTEQYHQWATPRLLAALGGSKEEDNPWAG